MRGRIDRDHQAHFASRMDPFFPKCPCTPLSVLASSWARLPPASAVETRVTARTHARARGALILQVDEASISCHGHVGIAMPTLSFWCAFSGRRCFCHLPISATRAPRRHRGYNLVDLLGFQQNREGLQCVMHEPPNARLHRKTATKLDIGQDKNCVCVMKAPLPLFAQRAPTHYSIS